MTTPKEFEYDLWRTPEGKFFVRIKETKEVFEVDMATFQFLHNQAMELYREQQGIPVYTVQNGKSRLIKRMPLLHLDCDNMVESGTWAVANGAMEADYIVMQTEIDFRNSLTTKQLGVYQNCMLGDMSNTAYAHYIGVSESAIRKTIKQIQKKANTFFDTGCE